MKKNLTSLILFVVVIFFLPSTAFAEDTGAQLSQAILTNDFKTFKATVDHLRNVDTPETYMGTPLMSASAHGNLDMVKYLLKKGANVNAHPSSFFEFRALDRAKTTEIVQVLIDAKAEVNYTGGELLRTPLMIFAWNGDLETVKLLLANGAKIDATDKDGKTALGIASIAGKSNVVAYLTSQQPDPLAQYANGSGISYRDAVLGNATKGTLYSRQATITQIIRQDDYTYRALVTMGPNSVGDALFVLLDFGSDKPGFIVGDSITFYGKYSGPFDYQTVMGNDNTVPLVVVQYLFLQ